MTRFIFSDKVWKFIIKPPTPNKSFCLGYRRSPGLKRVEKNLPISKEVKKNDVHIKNMAGPRVEQDSNTIEMKP